MNSASSGPSLWARALKRTFDLVGAVVGLLLTGWLIVLTFLIASLDTRRCGFFAQVRVGRNGRPFKIVKIRTMRDVPDVRTTVTSARDPRITGLGRLFRKTKLDELPQLFNVLLGDMSFVGPRPDVPGFADRLEGDDRIILSMRPGVTGPATLRFRNEEELLAGQENPEEYNRDVIFPEKTRLNREYVRNYGFWKDIGYLWKTVFGSRGTTA